MKFFGERKRLKELEEREAAGESFYTDRFDDAVRNKILFGFMDACGEAAGEAAGAARELYRRAFGTPYLSNPRASWDDDFTHFFTTCPDTTVPTLIEMMDKTTQRRYNYVTPDTWEFRARINEILDDHRVTYDLIDGLMVPFESREMHQDVVTPVLQLLAGRSDLAAVEQAYQEALGEIAKNPGDAITDAGRALQATLELLGCQGNKLGPLIDSAKGKGLLAKHDSGLSDGIAKIMHWVSADRSEKGDAHKGADPTPDDAWLAVHVVGALILRLAGGPRGS